MRLITFVHEGQLRLGVLATLDGHDRVYDLNRLEPRLPDNILAFLEAGQAAFTLALRCVSDRCAGSGSRPDHSQAQSPDSATR